MRSLFRKLLQLANTDILGRDITREMQHDTLGTLTYLGVKGRGGQWEIERHDPVSGKAFTVVVIGDESGLPAERANWVQSVPARLDDIFDTCRVELQRALQEWKLTPAANGWREYLQLDSVLYPADAKAAGDFHITYFAPALKHFVSVELRAGAVIDVSVDG